MLVAFYGRGSILKASCIFTGVLLGGFDPQQKKNQISGGAGWARKAKPLGRLGNVEKNK